jgi:hypothetical protein
MDGHGIEKSGDLTLWSRIGGQLLIVTIYTYTVRKENKSKTILTDVHSKVTFVSNY